MKHTMNIAAIAIIFLVMAAPETDAYTTLAPADLLTWVTQGTNFDFLLIDVRDSSEMSGIIATDGCRPYHLSYNQGVFSGNISNLPKTVAIVLYCASGHRSGLAAAKLDSAGFSSVYSLTGGFGSWTGPKKPYSYLKPVSDLPAPSMLATTAGGRRMHKQGAAGLSLSLRNSRCVAANALMTTRHSLVIMDVVGRIVFLRENPFLGQTEFLLPAEIIPGIYFLYLKNNWQALKFTIVE
jgi:rhodanese-related sulfurtransferase